jgi:amino acid adenylation domain-containing protein
VKRLLQQWVREQAERRGACPAVIMGDERLSYERLEAETNQLARLLKASGCRRGDRVGLLLPKSPMAIAAIIAVLKADCIYVPLDPASPAPRLALMLDSAEPRCVLATKPAATLLDELWSADSVARSAVVGWLDSGMQAGARFPAAFSLDDLTSLAAQPHDYCNRPEDIAYILFTSGSTGIPKGVPITHASIIHFIDWATGYFGMGPSDRLSGHPPLHFDLSALDIFGSFAAGAQLHLVPPELNLIPHRLADFIAASELTQWFSVPSALNYMARFNAVPDSGFPSLRRLLWCGEVLPTPVLIHWMKRLPAVSFTNLYGPTEATIASSYYTVRSCPEDPAASIPIGTACTGEELLVLDQNLRPVPVGATGDLYIRGVGLSPGYWRDPEKTHSAFIALPDRDPQDRVYRTGDVARLDDEGRAHFVGRADSQVKSRGYRIELGEIESRLHALPLLTDSAVVAVPTAGFEGVTICCAYVPAPDADVTPARLRNQLTQSLPSYMLPSRWHAFDGLPKNPNGKVDRQRLEAAFRLPADEDA